MRVFSTYEWWGNGRSSGDLETSEATLDVLCERSDKRGPQRNRSLRVLSRWYAIMDRAMSDGAPPRLDFTTLPEAKHRGDEVGRA